MCAHMYVCISVETRSQQWDAFLSFFNLISLETGPLTGPEVHQICSTNGLVTSKGLPASILGLQTNYWAWLLHRCWGFELWSL